MATKPTSRKRISTRRRKQKARKNRAIWVYCDPDELDLVDWAANRRRQSKSAYAADAVIERAMEDARAYNRGHGVPVSQEQTASPPPKIPAR